MVIFDTNMLIYFTNKNTDSGTRQKLELLIKDLSNRKEPVGIPTPVLAEYLVKTEEATSEIIEKVLGTRSIRILPFGRAEAIETAIIGKQLKKPAEEAWQHVKFDRQILAIAKTQNARIVYSNDKTIIKEGALLDIPVCELKDFPLPPQQELDFTSDDTVSHLRLVK